MMRYLATFVALGVGLSAACAAEPALTEKHWRLSQVMPVGESPLMLLKIEKVDGKLTAKVVDDAIKANAKGGTVDADAKTLKIAVEIGAAKYTFEGNIDEKDASVVRGVLSDGNRFFKCLLSEQAGEKIEPIANPKMPEAMLAVQKLNTSLATLRRQITQSKDVNEKSELQEKLKTAQKEVDEKSPELLREVISKHADSPFALMAANQLLQGAGKFQAKAEEVMALVKMIEADAARYSTRLAKDATIQAAEILAGQKEAAALALPLAEKIVAELKEADALEVQSKALMLLSKASKAAGKNDAALEARLAKVESALDAEYNKKVPPFKPEKYAGRKDKTAKRVAVLELFTGAECPPCVAADVAFDALEKAYEPTELVLIQYHMHIPGPDPLTNPASIARWDFYREKYAQEIRGTPTTLFNGKPQAGGGGGMAQSQGKFNQYKKIIDEILEEKSDIAISGAAKMAGNKVAIDVKVEGLAEEGSNIKLRAVLVEDIVKYIGGNALRFHHHVVRAIPEVESGSPVTGKSFSKSMTLDLAEVKDGLTKYLDEFATQRPFRNPDRPMDLKKLKVIVLVQNDETKEVLNAAQFDVK